MLKYCLDEFLLQRFNLVNAKGRLLYVPTVTTTRSDTGASESSHSGKSVHRKVTDTAGNITANITSVASDINNPDKNKWTSEL
jgi:hypothetical protein